MDRSPILFCLGPTNTGKTHRAIERMLEHETGMIGLPLRLLAREVFDRVERRVGADAVALVTGEEKRIPARPRYFVCTVEAMPIERPVDFLAVDEIQLAGHAERGHVFTDRLLSARGLRETWFMGSDNIRSLAEVLVPGAEFRRHPRLSRLSAEGSYSLGTLPPRSAVVAFSARRVYELAEKLRARKGGAAIVHGGLSPRARNAQVGMFQEGEVDYLVATDAIGMGLNLDIDRVAFADVRKFDGRGWRELELSELGQIAGRAGRHTKDGGFSTFAREPLPHDVARAIERHRFPALRRLVWRNRDLDFTSPDALLRTLEHQPPRRELELVVDPEDTGTLRKVLFYPEVRQKIGSEPRLRLLWEVCQIPDYRNLLVDEHARLVAEIFSKVVDEGRLPVDFVHARLDRLARHSGDIDSITARISFTRTWNFVANQSSWVEDAKTLQQRTRQQEDTLSDALHQALLDRFVARRRRTVLRAAEQSPVSARRREGSLSEQLWAVHGSLLQPSKPGPVLEGVLSAEGADISLTLDGRIVWRGMVVGSLLAGRTVLEPQVVVSDVFGKNGLHGRLVFKLRAWVKAKLIHAQGPIATGQIEERSSAARGIYYQLRHGFGVVKADDVRRLFDALGPPERRYLEDAGIHHGRRFTYVESLLGAEQIRERLPFLRVFFLARGSLREGRDGPFGDATVAGQPAFFVDEADAKACRSLGYVRYGTVALRVDLVEGVIEAHAQGHSYDSLLAGLSAEQALTVSRQILGSSSRRRRRRRKRSSVRAR